MKETSRRGIDTSDDGGVAPHDMGCAQIPEMGSDDLAEYSLRMSSLHNTKELRSVVMPQIDAMGSAKNPAGWSYLMNEEAVDVLAQFGKVFDRNTGRIENGRPVDREDWQQIYAIFGVAGCGKSLLVDIFKLYLHSLEVGHFTGNTEQRFGLASLIPWCPQRGRSSTLAFWRCGRSGSATGAWNLPSNTTSPCSTSARAST